MVEPDRPQMAIIIRRMCVTCWITKTTNTHSECVIFISFPRQQCLRECRSMLRLFVGLNCLSCLRLTSLRETYSERTSPVFMGLLLFLRIKSVSANFWCPLINIVKSIWLQNGDRSVCVLTVSCPLLRKNHIMIEIMTIKNKCLEHDECTP
jgi:hypothetical protein